MGRGGVKGRLGVFQKNIHFGESERPLRGPLNATIIILRSEPMSPDIGIKVKFIILGVVTTRLTLDLEEGFCEVMLLAPTGALYAIMRHC